MEAVTRPTIDLHARYAMHCSVSLHPGAVGGMAGVVAGQPLDTLRIRLQQRECRSRSIVGVWRAMASAEGARGLFRGMSYPFYTTALVNSVVIATLVLVNMLEV